MNIAKTTLEANVQFSSEKRIHSENGSQCSGNVARMCSCCKKVLPVTEFHKRLVNGFQTYCKACRKAYDKLHKPIYDPIYRLKHPEKYKARKVLNEAKKKGFIVLPWFCESCGKKTTKLEAHHEDYSKPLKVQWLCRDCHVIADLQRRRAA